MGTAVFNGCVNKSGYNSSSKANCLCRAYSKTYANGLASPNQFYLGLDVETVARKGSLLSGLNCNSTPIFLRCPIDTALEAVTHTLDMFRYYDCIYLLTDQLKILWRNGSFVLFLFLFLFRRP